jgi:hypothetical protein
MNVESVAAQTLRYLPLFLSTACPPPAEAG